MEANTWFGSMCYIPLFETYGNGIPVVWYRKDWAQEWGIGTDGQINSYEGLEAYWQCTIDNGLIAYGANQSRGFFQMKSVRGEAFEGSAQAGLQSISSGGLTFWIYREDGQLVDIAVQGSGDEAFANFPEGWNRDFGIERYEQFAAWQEAGAIPTNREGNNGWAVPASSTKIPYTMKFLDWLFGSQEDHDLIQLGIEGEDFKYGEEEGTYTLLSTYADDLGGYSFSWNPNYALQSTIYDEETLAYREYEYSDEAFTSYPILGFHFDASDVDLSTSVAQCKAVTDKIATVILHGIKTDGDGNSYDTMTEMIQHNVAEAMENGGQEILDALTEQLTTFLAEQ